MESNVKVLPPEVLMEQLPGLLEQAQALPLVITGSSMVPFLVHGRDTVYLSRVTAPLKRGDMILYRRDNGMYVLHRIQRASSGSFTLIGDAQTVSEPGIRQEQILARVTAVRRKGKLLRSGSFWWEFFAKVWIRMVPLRPALIWGYSHLIR